MVGSGCATGVTPYHLILASLCVKSKQAQAVTVSRSLIPLSSAFPCTDKSRRWQYFTNAGRGPRPLLCVPKPENSKKTQVEGAGEGEGASASQEVELERNLLFLPRRIQNSGIISSCLVGLLTGLAVVFFNNAVHEIRDLCWDGIPSRGASWLREEPIEATWTRVILVPAFGGVLVAVLNLLRDSAVEQEQNQDPFVSASRPFLKALAASITLGTGNSLGPEGPSVEIGTSIAKGVGSFFDKNSARMLSLLAAGSAAGLSSGFNAAVAGCFFAVESVLWPSSADATLPLTNTTSMVILSAVIASVVSEIGLGSEPAFKVPEYDFRSPGELPLYLLLGILCGLVSLALSWCTSYMLNNVDNIHKATGIPRASFPVLGGLSVGLIALVYPEILYWGFENVDILLESRPFVKGLSTDLLLQLVAIKIIATSLCRASGLVGGYYAPSLFIGAATGMAYGKFIGLAVAEFYPTINLSVLEVASPQAYGLVGMAATLAGVCQVPLTAVLLLFELTQDYRIVLPLLGAVGLSSWISSVQTKRGDGSQESSTGNNFGGVVPFSSNLCQVESSLCLDNDDVKTTYSMRTLVSEAMNTKYLKVSMCTLLTDVIDLMLAEKESCAVIIDTDDTLIGFLTLKDIQEYGKFASARSKRPKELLVSELCLLNGGVCSIPWTATPDMELSYAQMTMNKYGVNQVPVVSNIHGRAYPVGILDPDSISLTYSALATRRALS
ncbi:chloride channel protein CLC-e isoform X2 [Arachis ipaensis]|uniref:chloride channel protein CLC-e isoform X2 n=1 Tax=Arachis ipaensis TaxID=130454 RepID=UPI0007AF6954|nr:chloride channel protein CLC-e isoform X2 [Arachis ipaensis]